MFKKGLGIILTLTMVFSLMAISFSSEGEVKPDPFMQDPYAKDSFIIQLKDSVVLAKDSKILEGIDVKEVRNLSESPNLYVVYLQKENEQDVINAIEKVKNYPEVIFAQTNNSYQPLDPVVDPLNTPKIIGTTEDSIVFESLEGYTYLYIVLQSSLSDYEYAQVNKMTDNKIKIPSTDIKYFIDYKIWLEDGTGTMFGNPLTLHVYRENAGEAVFVYDGAHKYAIKMKADVNNDGYIRLDDAMVVFNHVSAKTLISDEQQVWAADVNRDGKVSLLDAMGIFKTVAGK